MMKPFNEMKMLDDVGAAVGIADREHPLYGFQTKGDVFMEMVDRRGKNKNIVITKINDKVKHDDVETFMTLEDISQALRKNLRTSATVVINRQFGEHIQVAGDFRVDIKKLMVNRKVGHDPFFGS